MKAYNEKWVDNIENQSIVNNWERRSLLSAEQATTARELLPVPFYNPNIFLKVGLFIFTYIAILSSLAFISIFIFFDILDSPSGFAIVSLGYAMALGIMLEFLIKTKLLYRSGTDNALLYAMLGSLFSFAFGITSFELPVWLYCLIAVLILTPAMFRYGDPLVAAGILASLLITCCILLAKTATGRTIFPFVMVVVSIVIYFLISYWQNRNETNYYADCQTTIKTISLLTLYLAGNYYVVREGNALINDLRTSVQIDFAFLFYLFTAALPLAYVYIGLKKHNRYFMVVGLVATAISVLTFLHYFSTLLGEWESITIGAVTVISVVLIIRYLKISRFGITSKPDNSQSPRNFEALLISRIVPDNARQADNISGGDFGGGGAGSEY